MDNKLKNLEAFIVENKDQNLELLNVLARDFISIVLAHRVDVDFQAAIKKGLERFDKSGILLDSEEEDAICNKIEDLMDIVDLQSSGGYLNEWRYGFNPDDFQ